MVTVMVTLRLQSFNQIDITHRRVFLIVLAHLFFAVFMYGFLVNATILNIVERKNTQEEVRILNSLIGELESEYSFLRSRISYEEAYARGFKEPKEKVYASRKQLVRNITITF